MRGGSINRQIAGCRSRDVKVSIRVSEWDIALLFYVRCANVVIFCSCHRCMDVSFGLVIAACLAEMVCDI